MNIRYGNWHRMPKYLFLGVVQTEKKKTLLTQFFKFYPFQFKEMVNFVKDQEYSWGFKYKASSIKLSSTEFRVE